MFNIGVGEIALILVVALLVLGPQRLPELARGLGKLMRAFRRQTDEVRSVIEREFYRMDQDVADFDLTKPSLKAPEPIPDPPDSGPYAHDDQGHPLPRHGSQGELNEGRDTEGTQVLRAPSPASGPSPELSHEETPTHVGPRGTVPAGGAFPRSQPSEQPAHPDEVTQLHERAPVDAPALPDEDPLGRDRHR